LALSIRSGLKRRRFWSKSIRLLGDRQANWILWSHMT